MLRTPELFCGVVLATILIPIFVIDVKRFIIPDAFNVMLLATGILFGIFVRGDSVWWTIAAAFLVLVVFTLLRLLYRSVRGIDGLGFGDVKFLAAAVPWIGLSQLPWLILIACCSGLVTVLILAVKKDGVSGMTRIPFGPHLSVGLFATFFLRTVIEGGSIL